MWYCKLGSSSYVVISIFSISIYGNQYPTGSVIISLISAFKSETLGSNNIFNNWVPNFGFKYRSPIRVNNNVFNTYKIANRKMIKSMIKDYKKLCDYVFKFVDDEATLVIR